MTYLQTIIKFIIGITIIALISWNRFFRQRTPVSFENFEYNIEYVLFLLFLIMLFLFIFFLNIKKVFKINTTNKLFTFLFSNKYTKRILTTIRQDIIETPQFVYIKLTENINLKKFIEMPASYFTAYFYYPRSIIIIFFFVPQIVVATTFVLEIIFFHRLQFFFLTLYLLIPFIILRVIFFIIRNYSKRLITFLETYLNIKNYSKDDISISLKAPEQLPITENHSLQQIIENYDNMCGLWFIYTKIYNYMEDLQNVDNYFSPFVISYTSFNFFFGWSYILYIFLTH